MESVPQRDGRTHISLGPVEKWGAAVIATCFISGLGLAGRWFAAKVDTQGEKIQTLVTQQAVANGSLATISSQLTDVPQLRRDVVELRVRVEAVEESQKELRQTRNLK